MFWALSIIVFFLAAAAGGFAHLRWRGRVEEEIAEGAEIEWGHLTKNDPALLKGLERPHFTALYRRVHFPREPAYAILAVLAAAVMTLPFLLLISLIYNVLVLLGMSDPGPWVKGFYFFFGLVACWAGVVYFFARHLHKTAPGDLREEIIKAR